jgi:hypothetical protein
LSKISSYCYIYCYSIHGFAYYLLQICTIFIRSELIAFSLQRLVQSRRLGDHPSRRSSREDSLASERDFVMHVARVIWRMWEGACGAGSQKSYRALELACKFWCQSVGVEICN